MPLPFASKRLWPLLILFLSSLLPGCAKMGPPPGGPEDTIPPKIVETTPMNGSTGVDTGVALEIIFSEHINRESLARAFTFSPPPPGEIRAKWRGRKLLLTFNPPLHKDRTYVATISSQLKDLHGVPLGSTFYFAFSTGEELSRGRINGRLFSSEGTVDGWYVNGYLVEEAENEPSAAGGQPENTDSRDPDPSIDLPDASTQTAADGRWELRNLSPGKWRIFAFSDKDGDRLWTPGMDKLAVPWSDMDVSEDTLESGVETAIPTPDTGGASSFDSFSPEHAAGGFLTLVGFPQSTLPQPVRTWSKQRDLIEVNFDPIPHKLDAEFRTDPLLETESILPDPTDSSRVRIRLLEPAAGDSLFLRIIGSFGTRDTLDTTLTVDLTHSAELDTLPPNLAATVPEAEGVLFPSADTVRLVFSEEMSPPVSGALTAVMNGTDTLEVYSAAEPPFCWTGVPETGKLGGTLTFTLFGELVSDRAGNTMTDSVVTFSFTVLPPDSLGKISGKVVWDGGRGPVHLILHSLTGKLPNRKLILPEPESFRFEQVPAGQWQLEGWRDFDGNGVLSPGQAVPFTPADPYTWSADTIFVRARWESGENELLFPEGD